MKDQRAIDSLIASEKAKLEKLEGKLATLTKQIKTCKSNIDKYTMMKNNESFNVISNALNGKGISFEDIISAINAGDMLSLQEKMETAESVSAAVESVSEDDE